MNRQETVPSTINTNFENLQRYYLESSYTIQYFDGYPSLNKNLYLCYLLMQKEKHISNTLLLMRRG